MTVIWILLYHLKMMNGNNEIDWQLIQCFKKEVKAECQLTCVTYFSASRCISSRFCLRNSLRRSKSKSSSMMIHTAFLGANWKRERVRHCGIYKDLNCPDHSNSKSRLSLSAVWLITYQDHNIPVSWSSFPGTTTRKGKLCHTFNYVTNLLYKWK